uniref:Putative secreted protein n=1 Tax=Ixodes ricinus TaxID=34613 RepID=A0A6B0UUW0_IXORI
MVVIAGVGLSFALVLLLCPFPSMAVQRTDTLEPPHKDLLSKKGISSHQLGCKELRSKRYISDGHCSSARPLTEVVCAGACLPLDQLPWYSDSSTATLPHGSPWSCANGQTRFKRVHLLCPNGERKIYRVPILKSCRCVRNAQHVLHGS